MATGTVVIDSMPTAPGWVNHEAGPPEKWIGGWSALPRREQDVRYSEARLMESNR